MLRFILRSGAAAATAAALGLTGCASNSANAGASARADARAVPGWDVSGSPTWAANQGRAPTPDIAPVAVEAPFALTGEEAAGRDTGDAWRQSNPRFGVGNAVVLFPATR